MPNNGKDLERAVEIVERLILGAHTVPAHRMTIEPRKTFVSKVGSGEVKDEVDLYVRIENAPGYEGITIFECRDRKEPVDKNDMDAFKQKMVRLGVSTGIFVARSFTSGAEAVASERPAVKLCLAQNASEPLFVGSLEVIASSIEQLGYELRYPRGVIVPSSTTFTDATVFRVRPICKTRSRN